MPLYFRYRCVACNFHNTFPLGEDPDFDQMTLKASEALVKHAEGRKGHLKMEVRLDGMDGAWILDVDPENLWKGESAQGAGGQ